MRLLADIGGTNVRFALLPQGSGTPQDELVLQCADYRGLEEAVEYYLDQVGRPVLTEAAMDVATAITGDFVKLTNSPWAFSIEQARRRLKLNRLLVINDFTALALSLPKLQADELRKVGRGEGVPGTPIALLGAGTGLGVSALIPHGNRWITLQGEGGHVAFSAMSEREDDVLRVLRQHHGHVSAERLLSGPGLVNVYRALCELAHVVPRNYSPEQVSQAGLRRDDTQCAETLEIFCAALGTAAANLVVCLGARAAVYIGGGIVPKLGDYFDRSAFRVRFEHKGRFSSYVAQVPTYVILAQTPALRGLAVALENS
ncbi:MAG: glucokinase [Burkholderiales bacterium]